MNRDLLAKGLAVAFAALAAIAAWGIVAQWGEPGLRTAARLIFIVVLLELAAMAWRAPKLRPRRFRERMTRLLKAMADSRQHVAYAESSPQVSLPVAFLDDWDTLHGEGKRLTDGTLSPGEASALDDFHRVIEHLRPSLLALPASPVARLDEHEAWRLLIVGAGRAQSAWAGEALSEEPGEALAKEPGEALSGGSGVAPSPEAGATPQARASKPSPD